MLTERELAELRRQERWSAVFSYPTYAFLIAVGRLYFRYRFADPDAFRKRVWDELGPEPGPVIWAANHLTLIDSFLVFWAIFPFSGAISSKAVPWSTPEYRNYYSLGGPVRSRLVRALLYLCRCIPFLREGEDEASNAWREKAFQKCAHILRDGGSVFVYPEAGRSRRGWFDARKPKDFLGRLALEVPRARFLCVYLRGDRQLYTMVAPPKGELLRVTASVLPGVLPEEKSPRDVSQRLFNALASLQEEWWKGSPLPKNCGGNDVVDLRSPSTCEDMDPETGEADEDWLSRHLTGKELQYLSAQPGEKRFRVFWRFFAAKEAAHKALAQSGIVVPQGAFQELEADLFRGKVVHRPTGAQVDIAFTDDDADKLHCVSVLRGGSLGDDQSPGDVLWRVEELPPGRSPGDYARERCLEFIASSSEDGLSPASLAFTSEEGVPRVLKGGKPCDWGVSLSHSGRWVAYSFMAS